MARVVARRQRPAATPADSATKTRRYRRPLHPARHIAPADGAIHCGAAASPPNPRASKIRRTGQDRFAPSDRLRAAPGRSTIDVRRAVTVTGGWPAPERILRIPKQEKQGLEGPCFRKSVARPLIVRRIACVAVVLPPETRTLRRLDGVSQTSPAAYRNNNSCCHPVGAMNLRFFARN